MARNIFYGGSLFFILIFLGLSAHSHFYIRNTSTNEATLTESVIAGKHLWEKHGCINCHTLMGEGAYFAPELMNVMTRWGVETDDHAGGAEALKAWMDAMPTGIEGRRQMPQFNLNEQQLNDLVEFLKWTSNVNTEKWPPNIEG
ncbi:MAG: cytochrome c, partial [Hydrogenophaga sp.]|nr:cytochrome c [Hydrogenophaga sp.]